MLFYPATRKPYAANGKAMCLFNRVVLPSYSAFPVRNHSKHLEINKGKNSSITAHRWFRPRRRSGPAKRKSLSTWFHGAKLHFEQLNMFYRESNCSAWLFGQLGEIYNVTIIWEIERGCFSWGSCLPGSPCPPDRTMLSLDKRP